MLARSGRFRFWCCQSVAAEAIVRTGTGCSLTNLAKASNGADQLFLGPTRTRLTDRQPRRLTEPGTGSCSPGSSFCGNDHVAEVGDSHASSYWPGTTYQGISAPVDGDRWSLADIAGDVRVCRLRLLAGIEPRRSLMDFLRTAGHHGSRVSASTWLGRTTRK